MYDINILCAGAVGEAISFVSRDDFRSLCYIEKRIKKLITRKEVEGFQPRNEIPPSDLKGAPKKPHNAKRGSARSKPANSKIAGRRS